MRNSKTVATDRPADLPVVWLCVAMLLTVAAVGSGCGGEAPPTADPTAPPTANAAAAASSGEPVDEPTESENPLPSPEALHRGVDVSGHSGAVQWEQVKAGGHTFAFVKATEGVDLEDPAFDGHWTALEETGLIRGAYHFYVTEDDPEEQARFFIDTVELTPGDLAPVVDIELIGHGTKEGLGLRFQTFLDLLEAHYGVKPIIYTSPNFWNAHLDDSFGDYPLWVAEYGVAEPTLPAGWDDWHLWQFEGDAEVPGVEKGADLTKVNRGGIDLAALIVPR